MKGKWAAGISPRHFTWVINGRLAVSERPGGFTANHRRVRRQEEIIWLGEQGFTRIISLLSSPHNLSSYEERSIAAVNYPIAGTAELKAVLPRCYRDIENSLAGTDRILLHHDELGDIVGGTIAGFFVWSGRIDTAPVSIALVERLLAQPLGPQGRSIVAAASALEPKPTT